MNKYNVYLIGIREPITVMGEWLYIKDNDYIICNWDNELEEEQYTGVFNKETTLGICEVNI